MIIKLGVTIEGNVTEKLEIVRRLKEARADVTAYDNAAIRRASENGHGEVVNLLIKAMSRRNKRWQNMILGSIKNNHIEMLKILVNAIQ